MSNPKKLIREFSKLSYITKLGKVKEILEILAKRSLFFSDLKNHYKNRDDIQENALDAICAMILNLTH